MSAISNLFSTLMAELPSILRYKCHFSMESPSSTFLGKIRLTLFSVAFNTFHKPFFPLGSALLETFLGAISPCNLSLSIWCSPNMSCSLTSTHGQGNPSLWTAFLFSSLLDEAAPFKIQWKCHLFFKASITPLTLALVILVSIFLCFPLGPSNTLFIFPWLYWKQYDW